jgi:hypothetical protein
MEITTASNTTTRLNPKTDILTRTIEAIIAVRISRTIVEHTTALIKAIKGAIITPGPTSHLLTPLKMRIVAIRKTIKGIVALILREDTRKAIMEPRMEAAISLLRVDS